MQEDFAKLENSFYQIKDSQNEQSYNKLIEQLQVFIDNYRNVLEIPEQVILAQAFELQLVLYVLSEQREKAEAIEKILDKEFLGIHKIGKSLDKEINALDNTGGVLNISASLLDMDRLKALAIKQKGTTKPKLLGWILKIIGFIFIGLAAWLFTKEWLWLPLIMGIVGVLFSTIGSQVSNFVNRFFTTIAFNAGFIIPGIITQADGKGYEAIFLAPLMTKQDQPARWGVKKVSFKKAAGSFAIGEQLAGVCILNQAIAGYHPDFMPTPICLGYRSELIPYKAKLTINDEQWQRLNLLVNSYKDHIKNTLLVVDQNLQPIS